MRLDQFSKSLQGSFELLEFELNGLATFNGQLYVATQRYGPWTIRHFKYLPVVTGHLGLDTTVACENLGYNS
jgi:hypothetical protein